MARPLSITQQERAIWRALSAGDVTLAAILTNALAPRETGQRLLVTTAVIAAAPADGRSTLHDLGQALPKTQYNSCPGLVAVHGIARAILFDDWCDGIRHIRRIRHYCPSVSRWQLASVLEDHAGLTSIAPGSQAADQYFANLHGLIE